MKINRGMRNVGANSIRPFFDASEVVELKR